MRNRFLAWGRDVEKLGIKGQAEPTPLFVAMDIIEMLLNDPYDTRRRPPANEFLSRFGANHIHAVPGAYVAQLEQVCRPLDVDFQFLGG